MDDIWNRFITDMLARVTGPMKFRLVLQPLMASYFAIRAGLADARTGTPPYFWHLARDRADRKAIIEDGWKRVGKVFLLAVVLDVIYQLWVLNTVYPLQAFAVAVILAILPYLVLRGVTNRMARREWHRSSLPDATTHRHS